MEENNRKYSNDEITVYWKPVECIHSAICYRNLIEVFNPSERPWVNMKGASTDEIIDIVKRCPTDALTYTYNDGRPSDKPPENFPDLSAENRDPSEEKQEHIKVEAIKGGPLLIEGSLKIIDPDGNETIRPKIGYFCRCGHSNNMPFCDGSHRKHDFDK